MFKFITSFFTRSSNVEDLSLEASCSVLQETPSNNENTSETTNNASINYKTESNNYAIKTGTITGIVDNTYTIDGLYEFESHDTAALSIGTKVLYHKYISGGVINIYNVTALTSDWDHVIETDTIWCNRTLIKQVTKRDKRILTLSPDETTVDLDKVHVNFIPIVGDWLQLDAKCVVDDKSINLSGDIIEINSVSPLRSRINTGTVTTWDPLEKIGTVNRNIYFDKDSLAYSGYLPIKGDKIIAEVIESDQNQCKCMWRALKLIPDFNNSNKHNTNSLKSLNVITSEHPNIEVNDINLTFSKLSDTQKFCVNIKNVSQDNIEITGAEYQRQSSSQCRLLTNINSTIIGANDFYELVCECCARNIGNSSELLLITFSNFHIIKTININVKIDSNSNATTGYRKNFNNFVPLSNYNGDYVIKGRNKYNAPRFATIRIPAYALPHKLFDLVTKYRANNIEYNTAYLMEELKMVKPVLFSNLTHLNYVDRFHTLLHLDEIENLIGIRVYDQEKACFIENQEYLMLEIENLSERRPSIILGDTVIATDPFGKSPEQYEGRIHKVGAKHVYLQFSASFHENYRGEDYTIKVVPSRGAYKKLHHAVHLTSMHLGRDIMFPTKIVENENLQVDVYWQDRVGNSKSNGVISPRQVLKRMKEFKEGKCIENQNESVTEDVRNGSNSLRLEWYNEALNSKQKDAVSNILKGVARPLPYVIFGPPGTGKTVTVIETILQILRLIPESRLLVTAPSNSASDLIAMRLIDSGVLKPGDLVRLVSANYVLSDHIPAKLVPYCVTASLAKEGTTQDENVVNKDGIIMDCSKLVLGRHKITVSTCTSAGYLFQMGFPRGHFTHIIVDEAGQAAETEVMVPIALFDKFTGQVVLAGDPKQLGPVCLSKIAEELGLGESLLERLTCRGPYMRDPVGFPDTGGYDPRVVTKLLYNYRSLGGILELYSSLFYNGDLIATLSGTESPEAKLRDTLKDMLPRTIDNRTPSLVFHGVNGENYQSADSPSWYNPHEAAQVFYYVNECYRLGISRDSIGIITPYIKQVKEIRQLFKEAEFDIPQIGTVENFQGQECDVIILTTVRSCQELVTFDVEHHLGFVASPRRLNVAISRAKSLLIIVGNPTLLRKDMYWRNVLQYCLENGGYCGCELKS